MKVESKYNLGDTLYSTYHFPETKTKICTVCKGRGKIVVQSSLYTCPECDGEKVMHLTRNRYKMDELLVDTITFNIQQTTVDKKSFDVDVNYQSLGYRESIRECDCSNDSNEIAEKIKVLNEENKEFERVDYKDIC